MSKDNSFLTSCFGDASWPLRSVIARINRRLKTDDEMLKAAHGERMRQQVGDYYILNFRINGVMHHDVDPPRSLLGVLKEWEKVASA